MIPAKPRYGRPKRETHYERRGAVAVIHVEHEDLMEKMQRCGQEVAAQDWVKAAVIDLKHVDMIISSHVSQITLAYDALNQKRIGVYIYNMKKGRHDALELIGFTSLDGVYVRQEESLDEAVAAIAKKVAGQ